MPMELAMELPIMKDILTAMNISNLEIDGFEADDIIGTVARIAEEEGIEPLIITGDKDALQLATDKTHILITRKGISEFDLYDREKMIERYQLTPQQFIDLKGLMGDQSDNIPGIPGVGEKTGIKLLTQFGSVANLLANTDQISNAKLRQKVEDNAQLAAMSRRLAEINRFVPLDINIEDFRVSAPDYQALIDIYVKLEFNSFLKKLNPADIQDALGVTEEMEIDYTEFVIDSVESLSALSAIQNPDGTYSSWGYVSSYSLAQVLTALSILKVDPLTDSRFIKNGRTVIDALGDFYVPGAGFKGNIDDTAVAAGANVQAAYALVAYHRYVEGKNSLYDMRDAKKEEAPTTTETTTEATTEATTAATTATATTAVATTAATEATTASGAKDVKTPTTGDAAPVAVIVLLMAASMAGVVIIGKKKAQR